MGTIGRSRPSSRRLRSSTEQNLPVQDLGYGYGYGWGEA